MKKQNYHNKFLQAPSSFFEIQLPAWVDAENFEMLFRCWQNNNVQQQQQQQSRQIEALNSEIMNSYVSRIGLSKKQKYQKELLIETSKYKNLPNPPPVIVLISPQTTSLYTSIIPKKLINMLRIIDYLAFSSFQSLFIQKVVQYHINQHTCILFLEETHRKLKNNSTTTCEAWYSLLNLCIDYIAINILELYVKDSQRIEKLHEKILCEILDRTAKFQEPLIAGKKDKEKEKEKGGNIGGSHSMMMLQKKRGMGNGSSYEKESEEMRHQQREIIFNLLMKSKNVIGSVDGLCVALRQSILNKKINKNMHAKLSWKLHDLNEIKEPKIKNFKFLDLSWQLQAYRYSQVNGDSHNGRKSLRIKLVLLGNNENGEGYTYNIGVFYTKLYWVVEGDNSVGTTGALKKILPAEDPKSKPNLQQHENPIKIDYINMKTISQIPVFEIDPELQERVGSGRLQLSIYCSLEHCYSFVLNYLIENEGRFNRFNEKNLTKEEIYALVEGFKLKGKYSQAMLLINYLAKNQLQVPIYLIENLPFDRLSSYETEFLRKLLKPTQNPILEQTLRQQHRSSKTSKHHQRLQSELSSLSNSKASDTRSNNNSRAGSRGRRGKIFGDSPSKGSNGGNGNGSSVKSRSENLIKHEEDCPGVDVDVADMSLDQLMESCDMGQFLKEGYKHVLRE